MHDLCKKIGINKSIDKEWREGKKGGREKERESREKEKDKKNQKLLKMFPNLTHLSLWYIYLIYSYKYLFSDKCHY